MNVHQVVVAAALHDAVTNHARLLQDALGGPGRSGIYARHADPATGALPLGELPEDGVDVLVFHASIGDPDVLGTLLARPEPIVLVYHNVTPPEFFEPYDPRFAALLRSGRSDLGLLRERVHLALGVSEHNAAELRDAGFDPVGVAPLAVDLDRVRPEHADPVLAERLRSLEGPVGLCVGQLMPHKRPDLLVQAQHVLRTHLESGAALVLAGTARLDPFRRALEQLVDELALPGVHMLGAVSDAELAACYQRADVYVTASEHEGFCAPLLEAMSLGLPVVARRFAAVPETVGDAGVVLDPGDGPTVLAEAVATLAREVPVRESLAARGRARAGELTRADPGAMFVEQLERMPA